MPFETIKYSKKAHVARITLDRPEAGNVISDAMARELIEVCDRIGRDDAVYAVILTGSGRDFCRGGEAGVLRGYILPASVIAGIDRPVIAALNGDALGPGLELALACDIRLASSGARVGLPQVAGGTLPVDGGTQRLPRVVGRGKALELLLTADTVSAVEALEMGLVSYVFPPEALKGEVEKLAATIAAKGPVALKYLKEAIIKGMDMTLEQGLRLEADLYFLLHTTADRTEGVRAFLEKRQPEFRGE
ncbi:MAG: hypothetical protein A2Z29_00040 [Chloroflexi bacterium RBG_16_56_11]|nr:MAG: hypothetical protein A2Z29_00040 [Chloroflexi bacterium RBG_16_56_11]